MRAYSASCRPNRLPHSCTHMHAHAYMHGTPPRRYGLEFVRYTLSQLWLRQAAPATLRGINVSRLFDGKIRALSQSTVKRLR